MEKVKFNLNVLCITAMMLDSGGGLGLRNIAFLIIGLFSIYGLYNQVTINKSFLILYIAFLLTLVPGTIISIFNPIVTTSTIFVWLTAFLILPTFYIYAKVSGINNKVFVRSGTIFSCIILIMFFGRLFNIGVINAVNDYMKDHSGGFFQDKHFVSGDVLPNVYFQGTLSLLICGVLSLENKNYISYLLIIVALIVAPSRFGFMILVLWGSIVFIKKSYIRIAIIPLIALILFLVLNTLPFGIELLAIFNGKSDGIDIRSGHIESIFDEFRLHPIAILTGEGPGSIFYSKGFGQDVDNIELSQFEHLRKYGVISLLVFCAFYFWPLMSKKEHSFYVKGALVMHFMVSFSNPVLFSLFSMLFLAYAYVKNISSVNERANIEYIFESNV